MSHNPHKIIPELNLNWDLALEILWRFIETEVKRAGFDKVVVGLSGGVDSALAAALAVKALGEGSVRALSMPYSVSNPRSAGDAEKVAAALKLDLETIDLTPAADPIFNTKPGIDRIRRGNVLARLRMLVLFDAAAESKALVLGTGNKTEILLGYSTWYGDSACSLNPIGDLYKTQVWQLAAHLNLPQEVIDKVPSADLWADQTDEGELGFTYEAADEILYRLVDLRLSPEETAEQGYDPELARRIERRMKAYQFKRMTPPVPKMSPRTPGQDFLYARDLGK